MASTFAPVQQLNTVRKDGSSGSEQHLYKVIVLGDYAVGKTSLIKRYTEGVYTPNYRLTIGVDFAVKTIQVDDKTNLTLQLWDVSGHERHGHMLSIYVRYAIAGIIVFDLSRPSTLEAVKQWRDDVNKKVVLANDEPIPLLLLANKCDLPEVKIDKEMLDTFAAENGFIGWYAVSAQENVGLNDAMDFLIQKILEVSKTNTPRVQEQQPDAPMVVTQANNAPPQKKEESCCN